MGSSKKLRGISLLSAVYAELSKELPENNLNTEELLLTAQRLIDLAKTDYTVDKNPTSKSYAGYYSYDLCTAFEKYQDRIFINEYRGEDDRLSLIDSNCMLDNFHSTSRQSITLEDVYA